MTYLAIDIGGTKIAAALVTAAGIASNRQTRQTPAREGGPAILAAALALAREVYAEAEFPNLKGIGIGAGGQIDHRTGIVLHASDVLPGWTGTRIAEAFQTSFNIATHVDNDVNALAAGETRFGAARGCRNVAFLALGTGIGGALILDGKLYHGATHTGGELGQILINYDANARQDLGGARGTLEAYASGPALERTYQELTGNHLRGQQIAAQSAADPSSPAARAIEITGTYLGYGLVTIANAFDPEIIVIGGGLSALGDQLLNPARQVLADRALPGPSQCRIVPAQLGENAAVIGAATLAMPDYGM